MASKAVFVIASAIFVQAAFCQYVKPKSYVSDNVFIDNDVFVSSGYGDSTYGYGAASAGKAYGFGIGSAGVGLSGNAYGVGIGSTGAGLNGVGLGGVGLGGIGLGGVGLGAVGLGSVSTESIGVGSNGLGGLTAAAQPLVVTSISPKGPSGLAVASENVLEGTLLVTGELPFLSAVAFEGALPTAGSGVASCGCGSGSVGIVSEGFSGRPGLYF